MATFNTIPCEECGTIAMLNFNPSDKLTTVLQGLYRVTAIAVPDNPCDECQDFVANGFASKMEGGRYLLQLDYMEESFLQECIALDPDWKSDASALN